MATMVGTGLAVVIEYSGDPSAFSERVMARDFLGDLPMEFYLAVLCSISLLNLPFLLLDVQLLVLHLFLLSQDLTTYEYIIRKEDDRAANGSAVGDDRQSGEHSNRVRKLPSWMDWIFFSRCGRRRRKTPPGDKPK